MIICKVTTDLESPREMLLVRELASSEVFWKKIHGQKDENFECSLWMVTFLL